MLGGSADAADADIGAAVRAAACFPSKRPGPDPPDALADAGLRGRVLAGSRPLGRILADAGLRGRVLAGPRQLGQVGQGVCAQAE